MDGATWILTTLIVCVSFFYLGWFHRTRVSGGMLIAVIVVIFILLLLWGLETRPR
jgi:hypothetical protein